MDSSDVNINEIGDYEVRYRVEDSDYNYNKLTLILNVVDKEMEEAETEAEEEAETEVEEEAETEVEETDNDEVSSYDNTDIDDDTEYVVGGKTNTSTSTNTESSIIIDDNTYYISSSEKNSKIVVYNTTNMYEEVENKNIVVPYYYDEKGTQVLAKFSTYEKEVDDIVFLDLKEDENIEYSYIVNGKEFSDSNDSWASRSIEFVSSREILNGVADEEFAPKLEVSRAMIVTVLGRLSNVDVTGYTNNFQDVEDGVWYTNYVTWAKESGIASGVTDSTFSPKDNLTREQLAVIVNNYLNYLGYDIIVENNDGFVDDSDISPWASESVYALKSIGLVSGDQNGSYNPKSNLTRAELSSILERLVRYTISTEISLSNS